jgi:hypothetical protein
MVCSPQSESEVRWSAALRRRALINLHRQVRAGQQHAAGQSHDEQRVRAA